MATLTTISDGTVSATITSDGAELMSLRLGEGEYLWQGDESTGRAARRSSSPSSASCATAAP